MKEKRILFSALAVGMFVLTLAGCAKAPKEDIDAAIQALERARTSEADLYAAEALQQAEDAWSSAMTEVEAQNGEFALFRSYDTARELLTNAKSEAEKAITEAGAAKEAARLEVENLIRDTRTAIDEARLALETAPMGKGTRSEILAMKSELETLGTALGEIQLAFDSGKFLDAKVKAQNLRTKADAIAADIAQAKAKKRA